MTPDGGDHTDDASLVDPEQEGFGIPGQITKGVIATSNPAESDDHSTSPIGVEAEHASLEGPKPQDVFELQELEPGFSAVPLGPKVQKANLGNNLDNIEGENVEDLAPNEIVKTETRLASTDDYLALFQKTSSDSQLYYRGYMEGLEGRPLDEDLALLSKDYFEGYDQSKFYKQSPQQSSAQQLYNIKPNSNNLPRGGRMTPEDEDRGPLQLTDGQNRATASKSLFPVDVLNKFFEV